jgi:hypothetical protein
MTFPAPASLPLKHLGAQVMHLACESVQWKRIHERWIHSLRGRAERLVEPDSVYIFWKSEPAIFL